jgi:hypothetical protein
MNYEYRNSTAELLINEDTNSLQNNVDTNKLFFYLPFLKIILIKKSCIIFIQMNIFV